MIVHCEKRAVTLLLLVACTVLLYSEREREGFAIEWAKTAHAWADGGKPLFSLARRFFFP